MLFSQVTFIPLNSSESENEDHKSSRINKIAVGQG